MARPQKDPGVALTETVKARISPAEKAALDRLIHKRAVALAKDGITGQDSFSAWLRSAIRKEAAGQGEPVEDPGSPTEKA
jgi:hypothetical protein